MKKVDCQSSELALSRIPYSCLSITVLNQKDQGATHRKTLVFLRVAAWSGHVLYCQNQRFFFR
ncbi:hypothetical protein, partial [Faecalibaculum rodentium]|uniref:hypothetical protein n=1 Tax=Faecalibaculum rodentium TaxID=1702221 RepID=UPI0026F3C17F